MRNAAARKKWLLPGRWRTASTISPSESALRCVRCGGGGKSGSRPGPEAIGSTWPPAACQRVSTATARRNLRVQQSVGKLVVSWPVPPLSVFSYIYSALRKKYTRSELKERGAPPKCHVSRSQLKSPDGASRHLSSPDVLPTARDCEYMYYMSELLLPFASTPYGERVAFLGAGLYK